MDQATRDAVRTARDNGATFRQISKDLGISRSAAMRAMSRTRTADEFKAAPPPVLAPIRQQASFSWELEAIRAARDEQLRGQFKTPVALADMLRTDDALFNAWRNRIAPLDAIKSHIEPADETTRSQACAKKASESISISRTVMKGIVSTLVDHGIAIGLVVQTPNDDGTRVDMTLFEWPLEHVYWDNSRSTIMTRVRDAMPVEIVHGDGQWIVFRKFRDRPWAKDACLLPAAFIWAAHAGAISDWAGATASHGSPKLLGEMPPSVAIQGDKAGTLSAEAQGYLDSLTNLATGASPAGLRPNGAKSELLFNGSSAWQVFHELVTNREKAATRVYLGTDATLGSVGGAPGVDISELFKVATTILQGDFDALEEGLASGLFEPWAAINFGDSRYAPALEYDLPDTDAARLAEEESAKLEKLTNAIKSLRDQQLTVDQNVVDTLAAKFGVSPAPKLASLEAAKVPLTLAPTDIARVVKVREARASQGLPPLGDDRDNLFVSELEALAKANADAKAQIKVNEAAPAAPANDAPPA